MLTHTETTVVQIQKHFPFLSPDEAMQVKGLLDQTIDPDDFDSVQNWCRQCYNEPPQFDKVLCALNEVLDGHGVEGIEREDAWVDSYHGRFIASYVNMGDTYAATIVRDSETGKFLLTTWGDFVEAWDLEHIKDEGDEEEY